MTVKVDDSGLKTYLKRLDDLARMSVHVGILSEAGHAGTSLTLGELAAIHEFGAPAAGIPMRSFLRSTIDSKQAQIRQQQTELLMAVLDDKLGVEPALNRLGAFVAGLIQQTIASSVPPPNKPATVSEKGSATTLVDHGTLRASVTWEVKRS